MQLFPVNGVTGQFARRVVWSIFVRHVSAVEGSGIVDVKSRVLFEADD